MRLLCRTALLNSHVDFLELFLHLDLEIGRYLNVSELQWLYHRAYHTEACPKKVLRKKKNSNSVLQTAYEIIFEVSSAFPASRGPIVASQNLQALKEPFQELFLWAVLTKRVEVSKYLWRKSRNQLGLALVAASLALFALDRIPATESFHLEGYLHINQYFSQISASLLEQSWCTKDSLAEYLVQWEMPGLGGATVRNIASHVQAKHVIAHPCLQLSTEKRWKSCLRSTYPKLCVAALAFPFLLLSDMREAREEKLEFENFLKSFGEPKVSSPQSKNCSTGTLGSDITHASSTQNELGDRDDTTLKLLQSLYTTPAVKFILHIVTFIFLLLFTSWFFFKKLKEPEIGWADYVILVMNMSILCECVDSFFQGQGSLRMRWKLWIRVEWNYITSLSALAAIWGFLVKLFSVLNFKMCISLSSKDICIETIYWFPYGVCIYCVSTMLLWSRVLSFYRCSHRLGPLWILIRRMMLEMAAFLTIFSTVCFSAGIFIQAIMLVYDYHDKYSGSPQWFYLRPFFMFSGENFLKVVTSHATEQRFISIYGAISVIFFLLGNALMLNLLVAIFSEIFHQVSTRSDLEFKNEFLLLQKEYAGRSPLPPPFSLPLLALKFIKRALASNKAKPNQLPSMDEERIEKIMTSFESQCVSRTLEEIDRERGTEESLKYTLTSIDEQQARLTDMGLLLQECDRVLTESRSKQKAKDMKQL